MELKKLIAILSIAGMALTVFTPVTSASAMTKAEYKEAVEEATKELNDDLMFRKNGQIHYKFLGYTEKKKNNRIDGKLHFAVANFTKKDHWFILDKFRINDKITLSKRYLKVKYDNWLPIPNNSVRHLEVKVRPGTWKKFKLDPYEIETIKFYGHADNNYKNPWYKKQSKFKTIHAKSYFWILDKSEVNAYRDAIKELDWQRHYDNYWNE